MITLNTDTRLRIWLYVLVTVHLTIEITNFLSIFLCIYYEPVYVSVPIITCIFSPVFGGTLCLFTRAENETRKKLGWPERNIDAAVYYLFWRR